MMMALSRQQLDSMGCQHPDCEHEEHNVFVMKARCHLKSGLAVSYLRDDGILRITCRYCDELVAEVLVEQTNEKEPTTVKLNEREQGLTTNLEDHHEWCWAEIGAETYQGPFPTRSAAVAAARAEIESEIISIGRVRWFHASDYIDKAIELDELVERIEEQALGDDFAGGDDALCKPLPNAAHALAFCLQRWALEFLKPNAWDAVNTEFVRLIDENGPAQ